MMNKLIDLDYKPTDDEPFMSDRQKSYFREKLIDWKNDILREARETLEILQQENANLPDIADRASSETDRSIELRARDRQRKLISKIWTSTAWRCLARSSCPVRMPRCWSSRRLGLLRRR